MIAATFRPIDQWPRDVTPSEDRRGTGHFKAKYSSTLNLLEKELANLDATDIIIQIETNLSQIRNDGWPSSNASITGPRVAVGFKSKHGPLIYYCDDCREWTHNLRCIAMTLERLRMAELYGVTKRGEQYTGFKALPSGMPMGAATMTVEEAGIVIAGLAGYRLPPSNLWTSAPTFKQTYRDAVKNCHPDVHHGDHKNWDRLQSASDVLKSHHGIA